MKQITKNGNSKSSQDESPAIDYNQVKQRATIKWLLSKAFNHQIPDSLNEPFYTDPQWSDKGVHLHPTIVYSLANGELYGRALTNIYSDPAYHNLNHSSVAQLLVRKGVLPATHQLTETNLIQTSPLKLSNHISMIEAIMSLYCKEIVTADRVEVALSRLRQPDMPTNLGSYQSNALLLLWLNETAAALFRNTTNATNKVELYRRVGEWSDLSDGVALCALISFYCPSRLSCQSISLPHSDGAPPPVSDCAHNLQMCYEFCHPYGIFHMQPQHIVHLPKEMKPNLVALLADLFNLLEIHQLSNTSDPSTFLKGNQSPVAKNTLSSMCSPKSARENEFVVRKNRQISTISQQNGEERPSQPSVAAGKPTNWQDSRSASFSGRRSRRNSISEDSHITIENFGGSQDNLHMLGRNPDKQPAVVERAKWAVGRSMSVTTNGDDTDRQNYDNNRERKIMQQTTSWIQQSATKTYDESCENDRSRLEYNERNVTDVQSRMNDIRSQLEEKKRNIQRDKRQAEANLNKLREKLGKAAFVQAAVATSRDINQLSRKWIQAEQTIQSIDSVESCQKSLSRLDSNLHEVESHLQKLNDPEIDKDRHHPYYLPQSQTYSDANGLQNQQTYIDQSCQSTPPSHQSHASHAPPPFQSQPPPHSSYQSPPQSSYTVLSTPTHTSYQPSPQRHSSYNTISNSPQQMYYQPQMQSQPYQHSYLSQPPQLSYQTQPPQHSSQQPPQYSYQQLPRQQPSYQPPALLVNTASHQYSQQLQINSLLHSTNVPNQYHNTAALPQGPVDWYGGGANPSSNPNPQFYLHTHGSSPTHRRTWDQPFNSVWSPSQGNQPQSMSYGATQYDAHNGRATPPLPEPSPVDSPSAEFMAPQNISFIGGDNGQDNGNALAENLSRMRITDGSRTYRIPSPQPPARTTEKGFYVSLDDAPTATTKRPKPPLRVKKVTSPKNDNNSSVISNNVATSRNTPSCPSPSQPPENTSTNHRLRTDITENHRVQKQADKLFIDVADAPVKKKGASSTDEEEMERKKERILMMSLARRQQQEEDKERKEAELQMKREKEKQKEDERAAKKQEEKERRAAILEQYRLKKAIEDAEREGRPVDKDLVQQVMGGGHQPPARLRRKGGSAGRPRPNTIHVSNTAVRDSPETKRVTTPTNGARVGSGSTMRRDYYRGSQDYLLTAGEGSNTRTTSNCSLYSNDTTDDNGGMGRSGDACYTSPARSVNSGYSTSSRPTSRRTSRDASLDRGYSRIARLSRLNASASFQGDSGYRRKSNSLINLSGGCNGEADSGLGRATPRRGISPPTSPSGWSPGNGPGSLPPYRHRGGVGDMDTTSESGSSEYNGPRLYKQPTAKSNRGIVANALEYCVFPGVVNREAKRRVLEELAAAPDKHFLLLFRDAGCQFRALYGYCPESDQVAKLYGTGPRLVTENMFDKFFKYNSGGKCFSQVHTKHLTVTIDAFTIHNSLWQGKKALNLPNKRDMPLARS